MAQDPKSLDNPRLPITTSPTTPTNLRWQALVTRDPSATFVYGVLTTKIYCRPSCAARLARRANVEFYGTPSQAERAGFRPCKRCKPEALKPVADPHVALVQRACRSIEEGLKESANSKPTLARLAGEAGLTPSYFHRVFKKVMGVTPGSYAAGLVGEGEGSAGKSLECASLEDGGGENVLFQPLDLSVDLEGLDGVAEHEPGPCGDFGAGLGDACLGNEFDVLIAAEAAYASQFSQGLCTTTRAAELSGSEAWNGCSG